MNKPEQLPDILRIKLFYIPPNKTMLENTLLRLPSHVGVTRVTRTCNGRNTYV